MRKVIGVFSSKGGVGKTTCSLNIAMALHESGHEVMVMDCDIKNSNLGLHLGLYDFPLTIQDVLEQDMNFLEAIHVHSSGLRIVPASISLREFRVELENLENVLKQIRHNIVIDTPPGMGNDVALLMRLCDTIVVVAQPNMPSLTDAMKTIQMARDLGKPIKGMVLNRSDGKYEISKEEIEKVCGVPLLSIIPEDKHIKRSLHNKMPVTTYRPHSRSSIAFKKLAHGLMDKSYSPPRTWRIRNLLGR